MTKNGDQNFKHRVNGVGYVISVCSDTV